jgi:hypothetical protein
MPLHTPQKASTFLILAITNNLLIDLTDFKFREVFSDKQVISGV